MNDDPAADACVVADAETAEEAEVEEPEADPQGRAAWRHAYGLQLEPAVVGWESLDESELDEDRFDLAIIRVFVTQAEGPPAGNDVEVAASNRISQ